ncbi:MAG: hypothetical protein ABI895_37280 [Deltaproteobacteria bacterium]
MTSARARVRTGSSTAQGSRSAMGAALVTTWLTTGGNFLAFKVA